MVNHREVLLGLAFSGWQCGVRIWGLILTLGKESSHQNCCMYRPSWPENLSGLLFSSAVYVQNPFASFRTSCCIDLTPVSCFLSRMTMCVCLQYNLYWHFSVTSWLWSEHGGRSNGLATLLSNWEASKISANTSSAN